MDTSSTPTVNELSLLSETVRSCKQLQGGSALSTPRLCSMDAPLQPLKLRINEHDDPHHCMNWDNQYYAHFFNLTALIFYVRTSADVVALMEHSESSSLKEFQMFCLGQMLRNSVMHCLCAMHVTPLNAFKCLATFWKRRSSSPSNLRLQLDNSFVSGSWEPLRSQYITSSTLTIASFRRPEVDDTSAI